MIRIATRLGDAFASLLKELQIWGVGTSVMLWRRWLLEGKWHLGCLRMLHAFEELAWFIAIFIARPFSLLGFFGVFLEEIRAQVESDLVEVTRLLLICNQTTQRSRVTSAIGYH